MSAEPAEASEDRLVGIMIQDRFLVLGRIAAGGMGVVYKAEQVPLGRSVALKILESQQNAAADGHFGERFLLEAAAVAQLGHPNTIVLYDYGRTDEDLYYYAMEYVDGSTLTRRINAEGPLPPQTAIHVALQLCGSLREAHEAGMVHRDLKPSNVMLTQKGGDPWYVKVLDFGLVKVMGQDVGVELTKSGMLMGSPRYMAPEQVVGESVDHRADIYAFGAVMYHALTGGPPFRQASQFEVLRAQVEQDPRPFADVFPDHTSSVRLERLIMRCLAKDAGSRPQTMNDIMTELVECARELGVGDMSLSSACLPLPTERDGDAPRASAERPFASERMDESSPELATSAEIPRAKALAAPAAPTAQSAEGAPASGRRLPWALGGALILLVGAIAGVLAFSLPGSEPDDPPADVVALPAEDAPEVPDVFPPAAEEQAAEGAAPTSTVRVVSEPAGARVRHGDEDLGDTPLTLHIPEGERWELTLSHDGHESRTVVASAHREQMSVHLQPAVAEPEDRRRSQRRAAARRAARAARAAPEEGSTSSDRSDTTEAVPDDSSGGDSNRADEWARPRSDNRDPWAR